MPPKIKNLVWRICRNCLPTRRRLRDKGVNCTANCALCRLSEEDSLRLLFQCSSSIHIWNRWDAFPSVSAFFIQNQDARGVIFSSLQVLASDDAALFCCILWSIWKQHNNKIWNEVTDAQAFVFDRAKALLQDWKSAKLIRGASSTHLHQSVFPNG